LITLFVSAARRAPVNWKFIKLLTKLQERSLKKFFEKIYRRSDLVILPSDFLLLVSDKKLKSTILEIRWHHSIANQKRVKPLLNYPESESKNLTEWEINFKERFHHLKGCVVYSEFARDSFVSAGFPKAFFSIVPLEAPKPTFISDSIKGDKSRSGLIHVGRSPLDKGLDIAVHLSIVSDSKLTVVGSYNNKIVEWLSGFPNITFEGVLTRNELYNLMKSHDVYVATGVESFGYSVLEALENGLKVVGGMTVGALNWHKSNPNVFLAKDLTLESLEVAVQRALDGKFDVNSTLVDLNISKHWEQVLKSNQL
jgi:glycosyltransferase involved in cell wall biosynthesis